MGIRLTKDLVLRLFCYAREAERSVDAALFAKWSELRGYYDADKIAALSATVACLKALAPDGPDGGPPFTGEEICQRAAIGSLRTLCRRLIARTKRDWLFHDPEVVFMRSVLARFLEYLKAPEAPPGDQHITLRTELLHVQFVIEERCQLPELRRASRVNHFHYPSHRKPVSVEDVLGHSR